MLESIVETSEDAAFGNDLGQRITSWNRSAERVFGYLAGEVVGSETIRLFPEHLHHEMQLVFDTVAAGDRVNHFETEIRRRDGMPVPISFSMSPVHNGEGRLVASVLVARDITEQRLGQATLAEVETLLRESEAVSHVGTWLWDVASDVVQWSDELHRLFGVDPLEFDGTLDAHLERVHPEDVAGVRAAMHGAVVSSRTLDLEYRADCRERGARWFHSRARPTVGSDGTVVGLRGTMEDVTDRGGRPPGTGRVPA